MKVNVKLVKKAALPAVIPHTAAISASVVDFVIADNGDDTCTVHGVSGAGNAVDISAVAKLAVTSSDPTTITVDAPVGMQFAMHAVGKLTVPGTPTNITVVATWNDGSRGPFTFVLPVDVQPGPATGVVIVPGTPTSH